MATITAASFIGEILIPNVSGANLAEVANLKALNTFIAKYEPLFLKDLLGSDLYAAYAAGIAVTPTPDAKWTALKGKIFTLIGTAPAPTYYLSPAANYIYFFFQRNQASQTVANAEIQTKQENAIVVSQAQKMIDAWNSMANDIVTIREWIEDNLTDYPEYLTSDKGNLSHINIYGI